MYAIHVHGERSATGARTWVLRNWASVELTGEWRIWLAPLGEGADRETLVAELRRAADDGAAPTVALSFGRVGPGDRREFSTIGPSFAERPETEVAYAVVEFNQAQRQMYELPIIKDPDTLPHDD